MRPETLTELMRRAAVDGDWEHHLREFLDAFYARHGDGQAQADMISADPGLLADARADAFLGGVGEHLARRWALPLPEWARSDARHLAEAWFVPDRVGMRPYLVAVSPVAFRNRLIFTGPDPLQRARFPYRSGTVTFPASYPHSLRDTERR